ncbi:hypothetical protein EHO61_12345 [Leptospira fluminis]|uniref:Uncharacterized protein n=1 Tax=Leptospira fluminis TaxID=2484979 RepID=A0A4R9GLW8_9LEPT|nr:hypothetical protein [Leptospira fluminis]TGK17204.1 hypothetical protein EHO61_12345 [Leptospira fluminis]
MDGLSTQILQDIFASTQDGGFLTMRDLELKVSESERRLRPILEDLKESRMIVEYSEGFQIAKIGSQYCRARWG